MTKYEGSNPILKQAYKYCDMGFYPILKVMGNHYTVLTPFGLARTVDQLEYPTSISNFTYQILEDWEVVSIEGFYNPPSELFKVGDLVQLKNCYNKSGGIKYKVEGIWMGCYVLTSDKTEPKHFAFDMAEPYLDKNSQIKELSLQEIADKFNIDIKQLRIKE
jgi:hypothetical protein